jgi:hypothetical protein
LDWLDEVRRRPLSAGAAAAAVLLIVYELIQLAGGKIYQKNLGGIDGTTLVELGVLALYGLYRLRGRTDLGAVAFTLVNGLSFIFLYEAIYKWSFYLTPFRLSMPPEELRQFVIQSGIALTALTGFAEGYFSLKRLTFFWLGLFVLLWVLWLLVGFPQITDKLILPRVLPIDFTHGMTYLINRATKSLLFLAYLSLFPGRRGREELKHEAHPLRGTS